MRSFLFLAPALLAGAIAAQRIVAFPQDLVRLGSGNIVPFGSFPTSGNFEEGRWQILIPNTHLPTAAGLITGMTAHSQTFNGALNYRTLRITMSITPFTALTTTFATNMPAPQVVLNQTNYNVNWVTNAWTTIRFDTPFLHDGKNNVVLEIRKEATPIGSGIATMQTFAARADLPVQVYTFGPVNSGAANAATATNSTGAGLSMRLLTMRAPTIFLNSPQRSASPQNEFYLGGSLNLACDASPGSNYITWVGGAFGTRFSIPGVAGEGLVLPLIVLPARTVVATPDVVTFGIPNIPTLVGATLAWQGAVNDTGIPGLFFTNGAYCIINP
jgi:hypothetical protein